MAGSFFIFNLVLANNEKNIKESKNIGILGGPGATTNEFSGKLLASVEKINQDEEINRDNKFRNDSVNPYLYSQNALVNQNIPMASITTENGIIYYKTKKGDTISSIAKTFNVSKETIAWANAISINTQISSGKELIIPPVSGVIHKIELGENLAKIAENYQTEEEKIKEFNKITNAIPGQTIVIPNAKPNSKIKKEKTDSLPIFSNYYSIPSAGINWGIIHSQNAVDIANHCGTQINSSAEGLVSEVKFESGYGQYIIIQHPNGTETLYAHLQKTDVKEGDYVSSGQIIGLMGETGHATGCHLHFEIHGAKNPFSK